MNTTRPDTATTYIALGSNLGDREAYIQKAIAAIASLSETDVGKVSDTIATKPLAGKGQPDYLNAVAQITTSLSPEQLHEQLIAIEDSLGRTRTEKWAPRTIDLDLLLYGTEIVKTDKLAIPHSQMHLRSFVLNGLSQLAPDTVHPILKKTAGELSRRLNGSDFALDPSRSQLVSIAGLIGIGKTTLAETLAETLDCPLLREAYDTNPYIADVYAGRQELALDSQLYFLDSRLGQIDLSILAPALLVLTDYVFDKDMIYAKRTLSADQMAAYEKRYRRAAETIAKPVLVIHLTANPATCLERIHTRNRPYEQEITLDTLCEFAADYEELFDNWQKSPVITIDAGTFDCRNADAVKTLANEIESYICRS